MNQGAKGVTTSYNPLLNLLNSMDHLIKPLDIYAQIPHTPTMDKIVFKIMMEILSALAQATKGLQQGGHWQSESHYHGCLSLDHYGAGKVVKKDLGEKDSEAILRRLDRLSQDEARTTASDILKVIYGLFQDMSEHMYSTCFPLALRILLDGKASRGSIRESLGTFYWGPRASSVSDQRLEILHQIASHMNKSKRQSYHNVATVVRKH